MSDIENHSGSVASSIEQGFFIFTLMPSLRCSLNCPHCYLSLEQRRSSEIMSPEDLELACRKVDDYYTMRGIDKKTMVIYWYGGEPTEMGQPYFLDAMKRINGVFTTEKGYTIIHSVLSSLVTVDASWHKIFHQYCNGVIQTSFDGLMRGGGYIRTWEKKVKEAISAGLKVTTISVVNQEILKEGPQRTLEYLTDLGISECGWLPFMWNTENDTRILKDGKSAFVSFAPTMNKYSDFMIGITQHWRDMRAQGLNPAEIGPRHFTIGQAQRGDYANVAGQTLFLLPNGDLSLPDYRFGNQEYLRKFGNILEQDFVDVLTSPERRDYMRKQVLRNNNPECVDCEHADKCGMEFWKENRKGDDCFGAKRYVDWLLETETELDSIKPIVY